MAKPKRIVNKELLKELKDKPCFICGRNGPNDVHHLTTKGHGGHDVESNLITLCRKDHSTLHQIGLSKFAWKFPRIKEWLVKHKRFDLLNKIH